MNKKIIKLIILKDYLIYEKLDNDLIKYDVIRNCLSHFLDDNDLENIEIYQNNLNRRKIMKQLRELFISDVLDKETYRICINFVSDLFDHYNEQCIKKRIY